MSDSQDSLDSLSSADRSDLETIKNSLISDIESEFYSLPSSPNDKSENSARAEIYSECNVGNHDSGQ